MAVSYEHCMSDMPGINEDIFIIVSMLILYYGPEFYVNSIAILFTILRLALNPTEILVIRA